MSQERDGFVAKWGIWLFAFGYFAAYVPYSILTKMATDGLLPAMHGRQDGINSLAIQAVMTVGSVIVAYGFISAMGWWKYATRGPLGLPRPQWFTLISGLCASIQIITTTLAYTFRGVTIALVMLFLRGGVLVIAPIVDLLHKKRKVHWTSWLASALCLVALVITVYDSFGQGDGLPALLILNIAAYLVVYFFRLLFMSGRAKSVDPDLNKRFFVEEQMVAAPGLLILLVIFGLIGWQLGPTSVLHQIWNGFTKVPGGGYTGYLLLGGALSTGTGIFGTLIFLDKRETTYTVPINRASSILAGVGATLFLHYQYAQKAIKWPEYLGAGLIIAAIVVLMLRPAPKKPSI
jgi:drug/metabolite transporter (DMT)-like permease